MAVASFQTDIEKLEQRAQILVKYRSLLEMQRESLLKYQSILDARDLALSNKDYENLDEYTGLEQEVIRSIVNIQRCIGPLKPIYQSYYPQGNTDINDLEERLERLRVEVLKRNDASREALKMQAMSLKAELNRIRVQQKSGNQVYASSGPSLIDLST